MMGILGIINFSIILSFATSGISQSILKKNDYYLKGDVLYPRSKMISLFEDDPLALETAKMAHKKRRAGHVLTFVSGAGVGFGLLNLGTAVTSESPLVRSVNGIAGLASLIGGGIIGFMAKENYHESDKLYRASIDIFTRDKIQDSHIQDSIDLKIKESTNGIGLLYTF